MTPIYYTDAEAIANYTLVKRIDDDSISDMFPRESSIRTFGSDGFRLYANDSYSNFYFDEFDFSLCLPTTTASTVEEKITYLATYCFVASDNGTTPIPTTSMNIFSTQPIQELDLATDANTYYLSLNGAYLDPAGAPYTSEQANMAMPSDGIFTAAGMLVACEEYSASKSFQIELMVSNVATGLKLTIDSIGTKIAAGADVEVAYGERVCLRMSVGIGTGTAMLSAITTTFTPA